MAEEVKMPQMGESIAEGTIVRWLKQVGEPVKRDEPLFEISTDKVDAEIPSSVSGTLLEIKVQESETVAVGTVVAIIGSGDAKPAPAAASKPEAPPPAATTPPPVQAVAPPTPPPLPTPPPAAQKPASEMSAEDLRKVKSSPVVRKIAEEHNIDISQIEGTGASGRVTKDDILKFIESGGAAKAATAQAATPATTAPTTPAATAPPTPATVPSAQVATPKPAATVEYGPQPFTDKDRVEIEPMSIMRRKID